MTDLTDRKLAAVHCGAAEGSGRASVAMGRDAKALGENSVAIGEGSEAHGKNSIAVGDGVIARGEGKCLIVVDDWFEFFQNLRESLTGVPRSG